MLFNWSIWICPIEMCIAYEYYIIQLRKTCLCSEFFWSIFSCIQTEYGEIRSPNAGKHEPKKLWIQTLFMQCILQLSFRLFNKPSSMLNRLCLEKNCSNVEKGFKMVGCRISKFSLRCTNNGVFSNEKLSPPPKPTCNARELYYLAFDILVCSEENSCFNSFLLLFLPLVIINYCL